MYQVHQLIEISTPSNIYIPRYSVYIALSCLQGSGAGAGDPSCSLGNQFSNCYCYSYQHNGHHAERRPRRGADTYVPSTAGSSCLERSHLLHHPAVLVLGRAGTRCAARGFFFIKLFYYYRLVRSNPPQPGAVRGKAACSPVARGGISLATSFLGGLPRLVGISREALSAAAPAAALLLWTTTTTAMRCVPPPPPQPPGGRREAYLWAVNWLCLAAWIFHARLGCHGRPPGLEALAPPACCSACWCCVGRLDCRPVVWSGFGASCHDSCGLP